MKILYYYSQLNIGGAERSTARLLNLMQKRGYDVTLLLRWDGGKLEHELDKDVKRIYLKHERNSRFFGKIGDICWQLLQWSLGKIRQKKLKNTEYDIAISGLFGYDPKILFKDVKAKQHYQMLRNDVEKTGNYGKTREYMEAYGDKFDRYIGVSGYTTESFKRCYPKLADRAECIYNVITVPVAEGEISAPEIYNKAENKIKILTVGRISDKAKGFFRALDVFARLADEGFNNFCWFIVGDGEDREELSRKITEKGLQNTVFLCGGTDNPFSYYRYADLVAVLSYYEGLCGVVNEAKLMQRPLIATRFSGITEQITDGVNGYIVENDSQAIYEGLKKLLSNRQLIEKTAINGLPEKLLDNNRKADRFKEIFNEVLKG